MSEILPDSSHVGIPIGLPYDSPLPSSHNAIKCPVPTYHLPFCCTSCGQHPA